MDGLLVIDKPVGPTSHDVVARMRRALGERRIGHTGTLDPAASGVLPLVIGRATRLARFLSAGDKQYDAVVQLGITTDTYDAQGTVVGGSGSIGPACTRETIDSALAEWRGTHLQQPPAFSAKKIDGRRSYDAARSRTRSPAPNAPARLPAPTRVTAYRIDLVGIDQNRVRLRIHCSAGFYVRVLAHELGQRLGTGAHLAALRRTSSAGFSIANATPLDTAERNPEAAAEALVPLVDVLPNVPLVVLTDGGMQRALHGRAVGSSDVQPADREVLAQASGDVRRVADADDFAAGASRTHPAGLVRLVDSRRQLVAVALAAPTPGLLHPCVVLM